VSALAPWYRDHGRHNLPWRATRDRWAVLVSEVMLHQTQVARVADAWPVFMAQFPSPDATAAAAPGDVIRAWGRLGYPRRARRLWEAACSIADEGWPADLVELPGVGRYTADAVAAEVDDADVVGIDVNIRRVVERTAGRALGRTEAEEQARDIAPDLRGRDRLLALMDLGATVCRPRAPACPTCPLRRSCSTRGPRPDEPRVRQARFEGSFRQRRGCVLAALREGPAPAHRLDADALVSLTNDGLAVVEGELARLP